MPPLPALRTQQREYFTCINCRKAANGLSSLILRLPVRFSLTRQRYEPHRNGPPEPMCRRCAEMTIANMRAGIVPKVAVFLEEDYLDRAYGAAL